MITFIVQARVGSTRLPQKILLPFYEGKSILELLIAKLRLVSNTQILIATSDDSKNDVIEEIALSNNVKCFRGSENDVLQRFIDAAEYVGAEQIIRVCSDNPFLELASIQTLVNRVSDEKCDYMSFWVDGKPSIKTHFGFWTEYVTLKALKKVRVLTEDSLYHEHVTNFIYSHPKDFVVSWINGPDVLKGRDDIRLTTDTIEDFKTAQTVYSRLVGVQIYPTIAQVVSFLDQHGELLQCATTILFIRTILLHNFLWQ